MYLENWVKIMSLDVVAFEAHVSNSTLSGIIEGREKFQGISA
jgi:hypothetical protein